MKDLVEPEPLSDEEVVATIEDFASAARNAVAAGFDGVELHGANGYLLHQFLSDNANQREDGWGGSREKPHSSGRRGDESRGRRYRG